MYYVKSLTYQDQLTLGSKGNMTKRRRPSYRYSNSSSRFPDLLPCLKTRLAWEQERLVLFGREVSVPRQVAFLGDHGLCYRYSGKDHYGQGWPDWLLDTKQEAERLSGQGFNSVLLNWYQDGDDYMGWHSDSEAALGPAPVVTMLSLGAERTFLFRLKGNHKVKHERLLANESWLVMAPSTQVLWQHSLPKRRKVKEERISLTFRLLLF
ncbi:alpha-ketoglutarate-dependent dioxygenase AlkB [Marinomonas arenicola]|uniref:alpha-ketoglutarate-dependent dioxygenase AlkB family protein n=1 Tax=Marinomonas arenicola TaxID=569601 RepID=UPI00311D49EA